MAINVLHYRHGGQTAWGVVRDAHIAPVPGTYATSGDFVRDGAAPARALAAAGTAATLAVSAVEVLSPVTRNQQFLCQAINYRSHMRESGIDPDQQPHNIMFRKASSCIVAAHSDIVRPRHVELLDYEVELGLVFARAITAPIDVTAANLHDFVAALVVVNDVSARDVQLPQSQFYKGKSYRTFGPVGPYLTLVDAADLARFDELRLSLSVNGEVRQDSLAADMVFKPVPTLAELAQVQDVSAGDLLATGTPGGCALRAPGKAVMLISGLLPERVKWANFVKLGRRNPRYLKPGDAIRASIRTDDGQIDLGVQENRIVAAA